MAPPTPNRRVLDSTFSFGSTATRCEGSTRSLKIELVALNGCEEEIINVRMSKRITSAFWKSLGEKEDNLLWTITRRKAGQRTIIQYRSRTAIVPIGSVKFIFYENLPTNLTEDFILKPKVFQVRQI